MSIRTKLVGAFLLVALLVPLLGLLTVNRVNSITGDVERLSQDAVPRVLLVRELDSVQRDQQLAVLAYIAGGDDRDRQRYLELSQEWDRTFAEFAAVAAGGGERSNERVEALETIGDQRTRFVAAAGQLLGSRATMERNLADLRANGLEISRELSTIRNRYGPFPIGGGEATITATLRNQITDVLRATEGMLNIVNQETALAIGYAIQPDPASRQQFEGAGAQFTNWLQIALAAGGPEDRAILGRIGERFLREFEPSARSMIAAADFGAQARGTFAETSAGIVERLDGLLEQESGATATASAAAEATARDTRRLTLAAAIVAFLLAGGLGLWFAGSITRPLRHLRDVAQRVSTGEVEGVEIDVKTGDEVEDLAHAFQRLVSSIRFLMADKAESAAQRGPHEGEESAVRRTA